jgi:hypothetical protein
MRMNIPEGFGPISEKDSIFEYYSIILQINQHINSEINYQL